jgi:hypothetical protein
MVRDVFHQYAELSPLCGDLLRVVPLQVGGRAVPEVDGLPVRVVPWEEGASFDLEFVGEDELVVLPVKTLTGFGGVWGRDINELWHLESVKSCLSASRKREW